MSHLRPVRTCFSVTCPRLDENDGMQSSVQGRGAPSHAFCLTELGFNRKEEIILLAWLTTGDRTNNSHQKITNSWEMFL